MTFSCPQTFARTMIVSLVSPCRVTRKTALVPSVTFALTGSIVMRGPSSSCTTTLALEGLATRYRP